MIRRRRDPLGPHRGSTGAQEPLLLQIPQSVLHHGRRALIVSGDESHRHLGGRWRAALWIAPLEGVSCFKCARKCKVSRGECNGRMQKKQQPGNASIFIDAPQRADPINAVTSSINAPPNGLVSLPDRTLRIPQTELCRNDSLLKRCTQQARKRTAMTLPSVAR